MKLVLELIYVNVYSPTWELHSIGINRKKLFRFLLFAVQAFHLPSLNPASCHCLPPPIHGSCYLPFIQEPMFLNSLTKVD